MPQRPRLSDETLDRVNKEADKILRVDPERVGFDERICALLDELEKQRSRANRAGRQSNTTSGTTSNRF